MLSWRSWTRRPRTKEAKVINKVVYRASAKEAKLAVATSGTNEDECLKECSGRAVQPKQVFKGYDSMLVGEQLVALEKKQWALDGWW